MFYYPFTSQHKNMGLHNFYLQHVWHIKSTEIIIIIILVCMLLLLLLSHFNSGRLCATP